MSYSDGEGFTRWRCGLRPAVRGPTLPVADYISVPAGVRVPWGRQGDHVWRDIFELESTGPLLVIMAWKHRMRFCLWTHRLIMKLRSLRWYADPPLWIRVISSLAQHGNVVWSSTWCHGLTGFSPVLTRSMAYPEEHGWAMGHSATSPISRTCSGGNCDVSCHEITNQRGRSVTSSTVRV